MSSGEDSIEIKRAKKSFILDYRLFDVDVGTRK